MKKRNVISVRVHFDAANKMGPGMAELLQRIGEEGSIAAAGRAMGMSYKRAWTLIETLNAMFKAPLVLSNRGGADKGGAILTDTGRQVLDLYREIETSARDAGTKHLSRMGKLLKKRHD